MDFLKKHYEKIVLGIVLVGLAGAVAALPFFISSEKQKLDSLTSEVTNPRPKPLTNIDLTLPQQVLKRMAAPAMIDFGPPNRLFNPMPWQKAPDGHLVPMDKVGPTRLAITNIVPLHLKLSLDSVTVSDSGARYVIGIEDESGLTPSKRAKKQAYCTLNPPTMNDVFTMLEVKGKPEEPTQIVVELKGTGEKAVITKDQPFMRVEGYMADLYYDLEKKSFPKRRVNSPPISFNGEEYNIVAITQNEVVLSAKSNGKKWTIPKASSSTAP